MSYEERKAAYTSKSKTLSDVPKELKWFSKFNTLKMAVMEKVENDIKSGKINLDDASELHTIRDKNDVFGFTERYLNVMMYYAFEEGKNSVINDYNKRSKEMNEAFEKMVNILDGIDMISESYTCDH